MRTILTFLILFISIVGFAISDGDVAASLRRSSEVQISSAHLARVRATKAEVRDFAQNVIDSQTKMNKDIADILNRQKLNPNTTPESASLFRMPKTANLKLF